MFVKFKDKENDDVYLSLKDENDIPDGDHVLVIPIYQGQLLFTKHKLRGIEFPGGKREEGESSEQACKRELFEETGALINIKDQHYIAQYCVNRQNSLPFTKDVFMVKVDRLQTKNDYLETEGPLLFNSISDIKEERKSYLLKDAAILQCLERVIELGFYA
ncbi:RNA deprotection pyrophosphohydrolase [Staphylococcus cohnii]|uniref:RNA deprotection pyrophosphohydrolase n=1 Tax=Staphylococcus cohnii TaxID=29382 RepID=UPI0008FB5FBF|nr:nucleoside triphosphatase YtkD [Staphylococcus cohnii]OIS27637.1 nucleoside triphosphatase [Staphylococcus cohnii]OIS28917.1 nucleoside triphosphatase [Staphylococcus cohnii]OIS33788.1 nucleoside triphosphatase [Staphylococcus cohnii]